MCRKNQFSLILQQEFDLFEPQKQKQIKIHNRKKKHIPDPIIHVVHMPYFSDICSHRRLTQCEAKTIEKSNQQQQHKQQQQLSC